MTSHDEFFVQPATVNDADVLARHRAEMFRDMGTLPDELYEPMRSAARLYFARAISEGEYVGLVATLRDDPSRIVGGAGFQLRPALPGIARKGETVTLTHGPQALVLNVYTEHEYRRRGLAALLMRHLLESARAHGAGSVVLHASAEGKSLYESLGFVPTNEMRYMGEL